jgi:flagellin
LNKAGDLLSTSLTRLSTGLKINSGKDDPAGLIASETLRSQVTAINGSIKNSNRANNVISTADSALGEVNNLLDQVRGLVQESLNNGALSQSEIEANQNQIDAALEAINRISSNTTFAGSKLLDGSKSYVTQIKSSEASKLSDFQVNSALFNNSSTVEVNAQITKAAEKGELRYVGSDLTSAATIEVAGSNGSQVIFLGGSSSKSDVAKAINSVADVTGVTASFTAGTTFDIGATQGYTDIGTIGVKGTQAYTGASTAGTLDVSVGPGATLRLTADALGATSTVGNISFVVQNTATTTDPTSVSVTSSAGGSVISVFLARSAGGVTATLADVEAAVSANADAQALININIVGSAGAGATIAAASASASLAGGTDGGILSFTTDNTGTQASNNVQISYVAATTTTTTASVASSAGGSLITVSLAGSAGGITASLANIKTAISGNAQAQALVDVSLTGTSSSRASAQAATGFTGGQDAGFLKILDNRNSGAGGAVNSLGGEVFVQVGDFATGTATASLGVSSFSVDSETGNITLKVQLAKASGAVTSTLSQVSSFLNTSTTTVTVDGGSHALSEYITTETSGSTATGAGTFSASGSVTQLLGGADGNNNNITFNDARSYGTAGNVKVRFATANAANQSLGVTVADVSGSDDKTIVFNLATDANGNVTSTADDIKNLLQIGTSSGAVAARSLVSIEVEGDGSENIGAAASSSFSTVDVNSRILKLQSSSYGSDAFVSVNVLSGSFDTKATDNVTTTTRDTGADLQATINGQRASTKGLSASIRTATLEASLSFNADNNVTGRRAGFTITGGGALFQIGQEVSAAGQVSLGIEAINTARLGGISGKLYELSTGGGKSLLDVGPDIPGSDLVNIVEESISRVSTLRGRLGAIQKNVIDTNISSLGVALENISDARSQITDTDFAETTAQLTKAQILNQSGISVLGIANQTPQQVLSLLG